MLTKRLLAGASAAALVGTALILTTRAADAATAYSVAPYVDLSAGSADMLDSAIARGGVTEVFEGDREPHRKTIA